MERVRLSYVTFLARDVAALATFYVDGLGLEEVTGSRDSSYREVRGGGCMIGFAHEAARDGLLLGKSEPPMGTRSLLSFDVGTVAAVEPHVEWAIAAGAELVRPACDTPFGQHQAVLRDPEGNIFRLGAAIGS